MEKHKVVELSVEEAREALIVKFTDYLVNDRTNTYELVATGNLASAIPDFKNLEKWEVTERFGELNLGQKIAEAAKASHVVVRTDDYKWDVVFDIRNLPQKDRWECA